MHRHPISSVLLLLVMIPGLATARAQVPPTTAPALSTRVLNWREDLRMLAKELPARHVNPFTKATRGDFEAMLRDLHIIENMDSATFVAQASNGKEHALKLSPTPFAAPRPKLLRPSDPLKDQLPKPTRPHQGNYWFEYVPEAQMIYLRYERCQD